MPDNKALEIQHEVRQNALKMHETLKDLKAFEEDMKRKEKEMVEKANNDRNQNEKQIPLRSNIEEFQKFHTEESIKKMKMMSIDDESKINVEEQRRKANEYKEKGNAYVKSKDYDSAIKMYTDAIEIFSQDAVYYSNRSQCYLNLERYIECIQDATTAICLDKNSSKSYYRRMTAYEKLEQDLKALQNCSEWMIALPNDQLAKTSYDRIHNKIIELKQKKEKEKIKWSRLSETANFVEKPPHTQSKKPLRKIPVRMKKSHSPIPDGVIDKLFNNNTGEHVAEVETDSKLFKANFMEKSFVKPKAVKSSEMPMIIDDKTKVNETNEILKACDQKERMPTLEELEAAPNCSSIILLPSTGPQFYSAWKEFDEKSRFLYLRNIANSSLSLGKVLGAQLDSDILTEIISIVHKFFLHYNIPYIRLLHELSKNYELAMLAMFLENDDKTKLNDLIRKTGAEGDNDFNNMIQQIKKSFQI